MSVRKSIAWAFSGQVVSFLIWFFGSIAVARLLSPHEMGVYAMAVAVLGIIQVIAAFGVEPYIIREVDLPPEKVDAAFSLNTLLALLLSATVLLVSVGGSVLFTDATAGRVMRVLALAPIIGIFSFRPSALLQREMKFGTITIVGVASVLTGTVTTVVCAVLDRGSFSPAYGAITATFVNAIGYNVVAPQHVAFRFSTRGWRAMISFGLQIMSISGVATLIFRSSEFILGRLLGPAALGLYTRASSINDMIFSNIYGTASRVVFTKLAKDYRDRGELAETFLASFQMIIAVMWPILLGTAVLARPGVHLLFGERWLPAALPLSLLMVAQVLTLSFGMNWELFVLRGETARQMRLEVARSVFGLICFTVGCRFGIGGAASGWILGSLFGLVVYYPHVIRLAEIAGERLNAIYIEGALLTMAAIAPAAILMLTNDWSPLTSPTWIIGAVLGGALLWLGVLLGLKHPLLHEMVRLIQTSGSRIR
jgi:O-antigen/teichoic acid export membrane protein